MSPSTPARGRPRSGASSEAVLAAAFDILAERGYAGLAIDAVAARAGVGKSTIYRWWAGRAELAVDSFFRATAGELALPSTASARDDFARQIRQLAALLRGSRGAVFAAMLGGARTDPELARALGERWLEPRRRWGVERMTRAVAAGECHAHVGVQAALGLLYGPLYTPLLFGQGVPGEAETEAHLALALPAVFRPGPV